MKVSHAGYRDPNNLKFEDITVLGVPHPPTSVSVTHVGTGTSANSTTVLPNTNIQYDAVKKVNTHLLVTRLYSSSWGDSVQTGNSVA